jgi:DNA polymerase
MPDKLSQLEAVVKACTRCDLYKTRTNTVFGSGNPDSKLMIIGEAPGADEDAQGKPFVGRSGQLLTKILLSEGINREKDCYIANILKSRPPDNRKPNKEETQACLPYLYEQIGIIKPKVILLLGATSASTILKDAGPITKIRGRVFDIVINDTKIEAIPTFHPSYLLRNPIEREGSPIALFRQDIRLAKSKL